MFEVRWTQKGSTVMIRNLHEVPISYEFAVSMAIKDLMYCIAYNEDHRLVNINLSTPLHLDIRYEYWGESYVYSSINRKTALNDGSFILGGNYHSFISFYQSHLFEFESRQFVNREMLLDSSPLTSLFNWWHVSGDRMASNFLFDREYMYSIDVKSIVQLKRTNVEYVDLEEVTRGDERLEDFKHDYPGFFQVLLKPIEGMQAYSKKHKCCAICETEAIQELEYGYCEPCSKKMLLPMSIQPVGTIDYLALRKSPLVDKSDFYIGTDYEYWIKPDGSLGYRERGLPF